MSFQKEKREGLKPTCLWVSALGSTWDGFGSLGSKGIGGGPLGNIPARVRLGAVKRRDYECGQILTQSM